MKKIFIFSMIGLITMACNDDLNIDPEDRMTQKEMQEKVLNDPEGVLEPLVSTLVSNINSYSSISSVDVRNLSVVHILLALKGNDVVRASGTGWMSGDYQMLDWRVETSPRTQVYWGILYRYIFHANQILSIIPPEMDLSVATDNNKSIMKYKASALTMRAFSYTYLMWLYQDDYLHGGRDKAGVPLYVTTTSAAQARASSEEVWDLIMADATEAVRLFKEAGEYNTDDRTDIDGSVASVVLARAAITLGDWNTAIDAANDVISAYPDLMDEEDYTTLGMTLLDKETIFGYEYSSTSGQGTSSFPGWMNIYGEGGYGGSQATSWLAIDQRLYDRISDTDYRKKNFVPQGETLEFTYPTSESAIQIPEYHQLKFATEQLNDRTAYNQNEIYMRASEMILLKAEAEVRSGKDADAQHTLYQLVSARDANYVKSTQTGDELFAEIQLHRRIELWGEGGFEFYDNKRWHIGVDRTSSANHVEKVSLEAGKFTLQIPLDTELNYNANITPADQNPL